MKTEMRMLDNGNYESVICPIQHECISDYFQCREFSWKKGLYLKVESGDLYEDGCSHEIEVKFCPFCGYSIVKQLDND